jgi:hypothetical protein
MSKPIMPVFAFERRMDIERECGFTLAGQLVVDTPRKHVHNKRSKQTIVNIIATLKRMAAAGQLPDGRMAMVYGWPGGRKPHDAVDTDDDAVMAAWAALSLVIALRLGESFGDQIPIDSDVMQQMMGKPPSDSAQ